MTILREIVIYQNQPPTKFRRIGYLAFGQSALLFLNLFFLSNKHQIERRKEALKARSDKKDKDKGQDDSPAKQDRPKNLVQQAGDAMVNDIFTIGNLVSNIKDRPYISIGSILASGLISSCMIFFSKRSIHKITLLPGERVRFHFFSPLPFTKTTTRELLLRDISCKQGRKSGVNYSILKFRDRVAFFLVDKRGEFIEPKLYDKYLGYLRSWADKRA